MPAGKSKVATKKKGNEVFSWIFDLAFLAALIVFFQNSANSAMVWRWVCTSMEQPAISIVTSVRKQFPWLIPLQQQPASTAVAVPRTVPSASSESSNSTAQGDSTVLNSPPSVVLLPDNHSNTNTTAPTDADPSTEETEENSQSKPAAPIVAPKPIKVVRGGGKPVQFGKGKIHGVPFYQTVINLKDPETFLAIGLPNKAKEANTQTVSHGHEAFESLLKKYPGAVVVNGTFFAKDQKECVMGNMVSQGQYLKYSQFEDYGTTLGLKSGNVPEMITARAEGKPNWDEHWFSLTCGPRLLKQGEVWLAPENEGFTDPHVLTIGPRAAIGFNQKKDKLIIVTFMNGLSLEREAELMKELGCYEAMNLDGGASKALAADGKVLVKPGRPLTNVIVVYDTKHPAPEPIVTSFMRFRERPVAEPL